MSIRLNKWVWEHSKEVLQRCADAQGCNSQGSQKPKRGKRSAPRVAFELLLALSFHANERTLDCWPAIPTLCSEVHSDEAYVRRQLRLLQRAGYVCAITSNELRQSASIDGAWPFPVPLEGVRRKSNNYFFPLFFESLELADIRYKLVVDWCRQQHDPCFNLAYWIFQTIATTDGYRWTDENFENESGFLKAYPESIASDIEKCHSTITSRINKEIMMH